MKKISFLAILLALIWTGCTTESLDTEAPIILEGNIVPMPTTAMICGSSQSNVIYAQSGDSIRFGLTVRDNDLLSEYRMEIHDNFDCHSHSRNNTTVWSLQKVVDIVDTEYQAQEVVGVPLDVTAGIYHCSFSAIDAAGNTVAETIDYTLSILNAADTISPTLTLTSATTMTASNGDTIMIAGNVSDNMALAGGRIELLYKSTTGNEVPVDTISLDTSVIANTYPFSFEYVIPTNWSTRTYDMKVKAFDGVGNAAAEAEIEVTVQ